MDEALQALLFSAFSAGEFHALTSYGIRKASPSFHEWLREHDAQIGGLMEQPDYEPPYLIIGRAADGRDGPSVEVKLHDAKELGTPGKLEDVLTKMFSEQFGHPPERVGIAVLPWVEEDDE